MLMLSTPLTQNRLNAAVFEVVRLRLTGPIGIPGVWDAEETRRYMETRIRRTVVAGDDMWFCVNGKHVHFTAFRVVITPEGHCDCGPPETNT